MNKRKGIVAKLTFISFLFIIIILAACTGTRKIIREPLKELGADFLFENLKKNEFKFQLFNANFNLDFVQDKKKTSFKGQIRIVKDSLIWVSFSPALGIEVARMLITNDSIKFINRINKTYFKGDYEYLNDFFDTNMDYDIFQAIILGNDLSQYENEKFRASIDNREYHLSTAARSKLKKFVRKNEKEPKVFIQNIWLNPDNYKISQLSLKEIKRENKKLQVNYSKFFEVNTQLFPRNVDFYLIAEKKIDVFVQYSKILINETDMNFPFRVPKKYNLVDKIN